MKLPRHRLFRLHSILLIVMLMVLALPLGGLYFFRIYEKELVRQTEQELISQSAVLSACFRQLVRNQQPSRQTYGRKVSSTVSPDKYQPIIPTLSLINPIQPPRPAAQSAQIGSDALAQKVGVLLRQVMVDTQRVTLSGIRLLDMNGTVIAGQHEVGLSLAQVSEVKQALQGRYASTIRQRISDEPPPPLYSLSRGTNIRVFVAFPIIENGYLQGVAYLSRTPNNILKHLFLVRDKVFIATLSLLALVILLVMLVSSSISRPIRELIRQTERIKQGEQKQIKPLKSPVTYEIAQLSGSFADMSRALAERADYIQRFATHVSHEFKTPLTSMQGALELLQDHFETMPDERRRHFIGNLLADTQRLKQLVSRLLELARADSMEPSGRNCMPAHVLIALQNRYLERGLQLHYASLPEIPLAIAPEALEMVLTNSAGKQPAASGEPTRRHGVPARQISGTAPARQRYGHLARQPRQDIHPFFYHAPEQWRHGAGIGNHGVPVENLRRKDSLGGKRAGGFVYGELALVGSGLGRMVHEIAGFMKKNQAVGVLP